MTVAEDVDLKALYEAQVGPSIFADAQASDIPVGVIVGGQPGAGKTRAVDRARREHDALEIPSDDLKTFHPDYDRLMATDPLAMPDATDPAMNAWRKMALDEAVQRRSSLVFETTMRRPGMAEATASTIRDGGFATEVRVLGVPQVVSGLGVLQRYVDQAEQHGTGRWTRQSDQDQAVEAIPGAVDRLVDQGLVDRLMVVARDGTELYDERSPTSARGALEALSAAQDPSTVTPEQATWWAGEYDRCAQFLARHETDHDVLASAVSLGETGRASIGWDAAGAQQVDDAVATVRGRAQYLTEQPAGHQSASAQPDRQLASEAADGIAAHPVLGTAPTGAVGRLGMSFPVSPSGSLPAAPAARPSHQPGPGRGSGLGR